MLEWSLRGRHELGTHEGKATFITLTYKPRFLPKEAYNEEYPITKQRSDDMCGNLRPKDMTLFWKRLRKYISKRWPNRKIRYMYCGEYGTIRFRPHYHAVIFGIEPHEIEEKTYQKIWGMGKVDKDKNNITSKGIGYIIGYASKKFLDRAAVRENYYKKGRIPPFLRTSKGIGKDWALKTVDTWKDTLKIAIDNIEVSVPRYYLKIFYKKEGIMLKGTTTYYELKAPYKIYDVKTYRLIKNPLGYYTHSFYTARVNNKKREIEDLEADFNNEFYFETLKLKEYELHNINMYEKRQLEVYKTIQGLTQPQLARILTKRHAKVERNICEEDWHYNTHQISEWDFISQEYKDKEQQEAKEKIENIFKGLYGKRQRMEELQDFLNEGI